MIPLSNATTLIRNDICYEMAQGDDSKETWRRYCELKGITGTEEEIERRRQEALND